MPLLGATDLEVFGLCLGSNVFGWTADERASFDVLDAYVEAGGNFIDTADVYMASAPGNSGGESETILGRWMAARANRDEVVIATKFGMMPGLEGLGADVVAAAIEASLRRLQTDYVDVYYVHKDDGTTPVTETLDALDALVRDGKVRHIAASNYGPARLEAALAASDREGLARFIALEPAYSLLDRSYEDELAAVCEREGLACVPYHGLARGFLTGKYRPGGPEVSSPRAERAREHLHERGLAVLEALDEVASAHVVKPAAAALAWVAAHPTVTAPIASARSTAQLAELLPMVGLALSSSELERLSSASR